MSITSNTLVRAFLCSQQESFNKKSAFTVGGANYRAFRNKTSCCPGVHTILDFISEKCHLESPPDTIRNKEIYLEVAYNKILPGLTDPNNTKPNLDGNVITRFNIDDIDGQNFQIMLVQPRFVPETDSSRPEVQLIILDLGTSVAKSVSLEADFIDKIKMDDIRQLTFNIE